MNETDMALANLESKYYGEMLLGTEPPVVRADEMHTIIQALREARQEILNLQVEIGILKERLTNGTT